MTSMLLRLPDIATKTVEFLDPASGQLYSDKEGLHALHKIHATDVVLGDHGKEVRDEFGHLVHRSQVADIGAGAHYAQMRADSTGRKEKFSGRTVAMDLSPSDVHTNATFPSIAFGYRIAEGMADVASPVIMSPNASDVYYTWNQNSDFLDAIGVDGAPGAGEGEIDPSLSSSTFQTLQRTLAGFLPTETLANADAPLKPLVKLTQVITDKLRLRREIRVANSLQTSGNWNGGNIQTLLAGAQWNGGAASDPVFNLHKAIEASYLPVTGILWSELVEHDFVRNPNTQKYFTYKDTVDGIPSPQKISSTLRLPPIYTAMMKYVTGGALSYVWGNHVVLLHQTGDMSSQMDVATHRTFRWTGAGGAGGQPDGTFSGGFLVRTYYDPSRGGRGGMRVVVTHNDVEVQTSGYAGSLILNAHQ